MTNAACPTCGKVPLSNITIHNTALRKQTFTLSPILPTCNICNSEVEVKGNTQGIQILLLNGTCGAGKSTTAEKLVKNHDYMAIDGDCVMQVVQHKIGIQPPNNAPEIVAEIATQVDILSAFTRKIVITAVIEPKDIQKYIDIFQNKGVDYRHVLLKPTYETAVQRTKTRTCHTSITPEEWVRHFYDRLVFEDAEIFDNTGLTVEESALQIEA